MSVAEKVIVALVSILFLIGMVGSYIDHDWFEYQYAVEDGFIEWLTVFGLLASMVLSVRRAWELKGKRPARFVAVWAFLAFFFFFGAGEEISWGQRILNIESSEFFQEKNKQGETNFHNLEVGGKSINKMIFGTGFALILLTYLAVVTPLYRKKEGARRFFAGFGVPIPQNYHIIAYVVLLILVEGIMKQWSPKRGELTEFVGAFIVFLNLWQPWNRVLFQPGKSLEEAVTEPNSRERA